MINRDKFGTVKLKNAVNNIAVNYPKIRLKEIRIICNEIIPNERFKEVSGIMYSIIGTSKTYGIITGNREKDLDELVNLISMHLGYNDYEERVKDAI